MAENNGSDPFFCLRLGLHQLDMTFPRLLRVDRVFFEEELMQRKLLGALAVAAVLSPAVAFTQTGNAPVPAAQG